MKNLKHISLYIYRVNSNGQGQPSGKVFLISITIFLMKIITLKHLKLTEHLGYSHALSDEFNTKITFDVGNNSAGSQYTAFLKIASVSWKANNNMKINFGMIGTKNFIYGKSLGS